MSLPVSSEIPLPDGSAEAASAAGRPVRMPLLAVLDPALMAHYVPRVAAPAPPVPTPPASPARPGRARRVVEEDPLLQRFNQRFIAAGHPANSLQLNRKQQVVATFDEWQLSSVFQPIVAAPSQQVIGHKALLRITGPAGHAVAAPLLFAVERAPLSVLDNVALPLLYQGLAPAVRAAQSLAVLETLGIADKAGQRPDDLSHRAAGADRRA